MSDKARIRLDGAKSLALEVAELLRPACERLEIAGSIRRGGDSFGTVGDLELLCVPKVERGEDLFGSAAAGPEWNELDALAGDLRLRGVFGDRPDKNGRPAWGSRYKRARYKGVGLDLFSVLPPQCKKCGIMLPSRSGPKGGGGASEEDRADMQPVPADVPGASGSRLLRAELCRDGALRPGRQEGDQELSRDLRGLREGLSEEVLLQGRPDVRAEMRRTTQGAEPPTHQQVDRIAGEPGMGARIGHGRWIREGLSSPASQREHEGQRHGTPFGDGTSPGAIPGAVGESPSPQRCQERQPFRESGDRDARPAQRLGDLPTLPNALPGPLVLPNCPGCGRNNWYAAQWGCLFAIRTGPRWFSKALVVPRNKTVYSDDGRPLCAGLMPTWLRHEDGHYSHATDGQAYSTPEESDVFVLLGLDYIPPQERDAFITVRVAAGVGR